MKRYEMRLAIEENDHERAEKLRHQIANLETLEEEQKRLDMRRAAFLPSP